jgi:hypothetical protein
MHRIGSVFAHAMNRIGATGKHHHSSDKKNQNDRIDRVYQKIFSACHVQNPLSFLSCSGSGLSFAKPSYAPAKTPVGVNPGKLFKAIA